MAKLTSNRKFYHFHHWHWKTTGRTFHDVRRNVGVWYWIFHTFKCIWDRRCDVCIRNRFSYVLECIGDLRCDIGIGFRTFYIFISTRNSTSDISILYGCFVTHPNNTSSYQLPQPIDSDQFITRSPTIQHSDRAISHPIPTHRNQITNAIHSPSRQKC